MQVMLDLWFLLYFVIIKSKTFNSSLEWPIILVIISNKPLVNTVLHGIAVNMIIYPLPKFASQFTCTLHKQTYGTIYLDHCHDRHLTFRTILFLCFSLTYISAKSLTTTPKYKSLYIYHLRLEDFGQVMSCVR